MWIEITDKDKVKRLINMEQVQVLWRTHRSLWISCTGGDAAGEIELSAVTEAQAEYDRIKGLLITDNNK